eukprot:s857_g4.t1
MVGEVCQPSAKLSLLIAVPEPSKCYRSDRGDECQVSGRRLPAASVSPQRRDSQPRGRGAQKAGRLWKVMDKLPVGFKGNGVSTTAISVPDSTQLKLNPDHHPRPAKSEFSRRVSPLRTAKGTCITDGVGGWLHL